MADSGGGWILVGLAGLAIYSCSGDGSTEEDTSEYAYSGSVSGSDEEASEDNEELAPFDEDAAKEAATAEFSSETYTGVGSPYGCTKDCSGHEAGFAWAAEGNDDYGTSRSQSFDEGQQAYGEAVDERTEEMRKEYEAGEEPY